MPAPEFRYLLPPDQVLTKHSRRWRESLPAGRRPISPVGGERISYGEYFEAARGFLAADGFAALRKAAAALLGEEPSIRDIAGIDIFLEKHGACYHPARVVARLAGETFSFVLNVAVSPEGRETMASEFRTLQRLSSRYPVSVLPRPFARGEAGLHRGRTIHLFLAEWFDGFHEFHQTGAPAGDRTAVVWDTRNGARFLSAEEAALVFCQATRILTLYYDMETFTQIFPWHHAAGDFVVRSAGKRLEVKLISARNYLPLFGGGPGAAQEPDPVRMMEALLLFLLHLSLRMRIDRENGVGELVWAPDVAVEGCLAGFWEGLNLKAALEPDLEPMLPVFRQYLMTAGAADVKELCRAVIGAYHPRAPETALMLRHLDDHTHAFLRCVHGSAGGEKMSFSTR